MDDQKKKRKTAGSGAGSGLRSWLVIALIAMVFVTLYRMNPNPADQLELTQIDFYKALDDGRIVEPVTRYIDRESGETLLKGKLELKDKLKSDGSPVTVEYRVRLIPGENESLMEDLFVRQIPVTIEEHRAPISPFLMQLLFFFGFIGLFYWFMSRKMGGDGGPFGFGKSRAKVLNGRQDKRAMTFNDVAGIDEAKEEVQEIVEFLKSPDAFRKLGGRIPKGVLLVGPPGTGKTLLARAIAGEAQVPFFAISGSDFEEMFVGVGASRMRDMFAEAKKRAPCIVFIDEIDAVGRARSKNGGFSSNDERENTLNQLLTEMDGFGSNSGVIILAATNRADILDKALMRAGRFDRQIHVELPDLKEREEIFTVHLRGLKLAEDFDLEFLAKHTPGFSGADIANVCNEAALTAARHDKEAIDKQDFLDAVDRIVGGLERKSKIITPEEKMSIAHHEAGHATVSWLLPHANPLFKVTIVPRGQALGAAWYLPEERQLVTKAQMIDEMCSLIGGRVAEEIVNGQPSTGALNDLERLTKMAYGMVTYYGMSDKIGNMSYYDSTGSRAYDLNRPYSEKTAELIDKEVKELIEMIHDKTESLLKDNFEGFSQLAALLLEKEVIFADDLERIFGPRAGAMPGEEIPKDPEELS